MNRKDLRDIFTLGFVIIVIFLVVAAISGLGGCSTRLCFKRWDGQRFRCMTQEELCAYDATECLAMGK